MAINFIQHFIEYSSPIINEIIGAYQCGFQHSSSATDQIFCIHQILEILELLIGSKKAHDSVRREVLYNILIEFEIPMKLIRLIKMCLNGTCNKVHIGQHLSDEFL
jgi:hypothetical protein